MGEKLLQNASSCAGRTVRANKLKHQSLEHRKIYCRDKQGEWVACAQKNPSSPMVLGEKFLWAKFGVRAVGCVTFFLLVGDEVTGQGGALGILCTA